MAAVESCVVKCADVPRGIDNATADRAGEARRQAELYRFRATDLLYYASSVSFFFADVATGEQRVSRTHAHTCNARAGVSCDSPSRLTGLPAMRSNVPKLWLNETEQT